MNKNLADLCSRIIHSKEVSDFSCSICSGLVTSKRGSGLIILSLCHFPEAQVFLGDSDPCFTGGGSVGAERSCLSELADSRFLAPVCAFGGIKMQIPCGRYAVKKSWYSGAA